MNLAEQIEVCCLMEATARKPGNVHPGASFMDLTYADFVHAARAVAQPLAAAGRHGLGRAVYQAIEATQCESQTNVNLGIALLIAPLASVPAEVPLEAGIGDILNRTTVEDAEHVYAAIRLARPGGLGQAQSQDVASTPTVTLRDAMSLAAGRDKIAEQYVTDFSYVLGLARHWLEESWNWCHDLRGAITAMDGFIGFPGIVPWEAAVNRFQLKLLADAPDSLVARKCGVAVAGELQQRALGVLQSDWPSRVHSGNSLRQFDEWLRADGHRRNPGTTADLIAVTLFSAVRDGLIDPPSRDEILQHGTRIQLATEGRNKS
jgi:triphosphoribosyl-dephospho-CoA synthase